MPSRRPPNVQDSARRSAEEILELVVDSIAASEGPAEDADSVSDAKRLEQWGQRDSRMVDPDAFEAQLQQAVLPQEALDVNSPTCLAVVKSVPEIAEIYASGPFDAEMAHMLARLAEFPLRLSYLRQWEDEPKQMVKEAERMDARWQRSLGVGVEEESLLPEMEAA